jgi:hypothetical protein
MTSSQLFLNVEMFADPIACVMLNRLASMYREHMAGALTPDEYNALLQQAGVQDMRYSDEIHSINDSCCSIDIPAKTSHD